MNKKNIVFRSGSLRLGGLERVLIEVLQTIDKEKYNITLVIDDDCGEDNIFEKDIPKEIPYYFLKSKELINKTEYYKANKKKLFNKLMYNLFMNLETFIMCKNMNKLLRKLGKIDVLIDFDAGASKYISKLKNINKKAVWIHNSIPKLKKKKSKIERFGKRLKKYDKVVAICDEMKEELQEIYPKIKDKIIRIYNPFDFSRISKMAEDENNLSEKQKELLKDRYCVMVSRLDTVQKDYETLMKAFKIVIKKNKEEKLYIVGSGPDEDKIKKIIENYGIEKNVKLIGFTKNPYVWIKNSLFLVHSSKYEGLPTVLIEALICGKTIISSECPTGPREILKNGECGELFGVGNVKQLSEKLINFFENSDLIKFYEEKVKMRKEEFNQKNVIREYEKLIEKI